MQEPGSWSKVSENTQFSPLPATRRLGQSHQEANFFLPQKKRGGGVPPSYQRSQL